jgi:hypothetical protein
MDKSSFQKGVKNPFALQTNSSVFSSSRMELKDF